MRPTDDHRHCKSCGKVCDPDEETCSPACAERRATQQRSRQNSVRLMYVLIAIVLVVFLLQYVR